MPLSMMVEGAKCRPVVVCDYCGQEITDARQGDCQWRVVTCPGPQGGPYFTHKRCCRAFEATDPAARWAWMPLSAMLIYLGNNLHVGWDQARETAELFASI